MGKKSSAATARTYLIVALICAIFGAVYEIFSHQVYSNFMIFAFTIPLLGGALPFFVLSRTDPIRRPNELTRQLYHCGLATLTVGSFIQGVLDIYGTTNDLAVVYWVMGPALAAAALLRYLLKTGQMSG